MAQVGLDVLRKLEAYEAGRPRARGQTITTWIAEPGELIAVAFLRMGGEARPWAVGVQAEGSTPEIWTVPDGRQAEPIGEMLSGFAIRLCGFLGSPVFGAEPCEQDEFFSKQPRQVWLPNGSHLDMLHLLNLRYTFAEGGEEDRVQSLRGLGRAAGYLFRESGCASEVGVVEASRALREAYTFPVDEIRASHLGLLIALLEADGDRDAVTAAGEAAEQLAVSNTLDPAFERDELEPLVERFGRSAGKRNEAAVAQIDGLLKTEIGRRLELTLRAIELLRSDQRETNPGTENLVDRTSRARWYEYMRLENGLADGGEFSPPSAETDKQPRAAARRYIRTAGAADTTPADLMPHDRDLVDEAVAAGDAIRGVVYRIDHRIPPNKKRRAVYWEVMIPQGALLRIKPGKTLRSTDSDLHKGELEDVRENDGRRIAVIRMIKPRGGPDPGEPRYVGLPVVMVPEAVDFTFNKLRCLNRDPGPGGWLTRNSGDPPSAGDIREAGSDLVARIEELRGS